MNNVQQFHGNMLVQSDGTATFFGFVILGYIGLSALICFPLVRRPIVHWYKSQSWFIHGSGVIDIMLKQLGMRLTVELLAFGIACIIGPIGGWIFVLKRKQAETPMIVDAD